MGGEEFSSNTSSTRYSTSTGEEGELRVQDFITGAATKGSADRNLKNGIVDNHGNTVMSCLQRVAGTEHDLIKVRNPWVKTEFEFAFSSSSVRTRIQFEFNLKFVFYGGDGKFEFSSSSNSIRYSTSAREGWKFEFRSSCVQLEFSSSSGSLLLGEQGNSTSVRVRVQFEFSSSSGSVLRYFFGGEEFELELGIRYSTSTGGERKFEVSSSSSSVRVQFEFSSSSGSLLVGERRSSSSVQVRVQFELSSSSGREGESSSSARVRVQFF